MSNDGLSQQLKGQVVKQEDKEGDQKMMKNKNVDPRNILVELSVIPLGSNGQTVDQINSVLSLVDSTGLFHQRTHNGTCIEGKWNDISPLILACYERVQEQTPQGYLKISIR